MDKNKATEFSATDLGEATQSGSVLSDSRLLACDISTLSKIFVDETPIEAKDPSAQEILTEVAQYSITPQTLRSKKFLSKEAVKLKSVLEHELVSTGKNINSIGGRAAEFKKLAQTSLNGLKKLSDGIVESKEFVKTEKEILDFNERFFSKTAMLENYAQELHKYLSFVERNKDLFLSFREEYRANSNEVIRFGINTTNMDSAQLKELTSIYTSVDEKKGSVKSKGSRSSASKDDQDDCLPMLHPLETILIRDAIKYCKDQSKKTVLADIFARNDNGTIKIDGGKPEVHTIVLYFQTSGAADKLFVIDPSNSDFSRHLATKANIARIFGDSKDKMEIIAPSPKIKIYASPDKDKVGPTPDQYRDCTDIAVKLAFGLNKIPATGTSEEILKSSAIKLVTNSSIINENLFGNISSPARIRQASDDNIKNASNKFLTLLNGQINIISDMVVSMSNIPRSIEQRSREVWKQNPAPEQYEAFLDDLKQACEKNHTEIMESRVVGNIIEEDI